MYSNPAAARSRSRLDKDAVFLRLPEGGESRVKLEVHDAVASMLSLILSVGWKVIPAP